MDSFDPNNIRKSLWQYEVIHRKPTDFKLGERVFLKSSPDRPMLVRSIGEKNVVTTWDGKDGKKHVQAFPPECLLQYQFASLVVDRTGSYKACLN